MLFVKLARAVCIANCMITLSRSRSRTRTRTRSRTRTGTRTRTRTGTRTRPLTTLFLSCNWYRVV